MSPSKSPDTGNIMLLAQLTQQDTQISLNSSNSLSSSSPTTPTKPNSPTQIIPPSQLSQTSTFQYNRRYTQHVSEVPPSQFSQGMHYYNPTTNTQRTSDVIDMTSQSSFTSSLRIQPTNLNLNLLDSSDDESNDNVIVGALE